jgi:uncharacterized protein (TIGR02145 family)
MKKLLILLTLTITTVLQAQAPQGFNYQATVRNNSGDLILNTNVYFKFNVIQGSETAVPIFTETHYVPTDDLGQVNLVIGQGTANTGAFSALDWSLGSYYLGIELDTGNGYVAMGTTQLLSVPYALYAANSGNSTPTTPNLETVLAENNSANNQQIKDLQDPTDTQDAVTKSYIDALMANLQTPSNIPTDGLVAYYPFNGNANDESGNGNHGTATDATLTYDRFDNENSAYSFDGDGDYIVSNSNVGVGQTTLTFSFWAKTEYGSKRMAALSQDCGTDCDNAFGLVLNKFLNSAVVCDDGHMGTSPQSFGYAQPSHYATVRTTTANNGWNNYVLIVGADGDYSFNNFRFYVNGIEQITNCDHNWGNSQWQFNFPDYRLMIGNKPNSIEGYFHGEIDDVAIWNRALTIEEINTTFGATETENNIQNIEQVLTQGNDANGIQLKGIADPTEAQDAVTKNYAETQFYSQSEVDVLIANLQNQIDDLDSDNDYGCSPFTVLVYGTQEWSGVNACNITYRDGTPIPQVTEYDEWAALTTGAWAYYDNDPTKPRLYNWYAVMGIYDEASLLDASLRKEFAPEGWHVPSDAEWTTLEEHLIANGYNYDGTTTGNKIAKAIASTTGWVSTTSSDGVPCNNQGTNNSSGFNAYPEGNINFVGSQNAYSNEGSYTFFWSSTDNGVTGASSRTLGYNYNYLRNIPNNKKEGFSVRFVRD